jgi:hypothetical protein
LRRKVIICLAAIAIFVVIVAATGTIVFFSPLVTHYIEGDAFRTAMENETAKGLHFPECRYSPIRRTSAFTAQTQNFEAQDGEKAMKSLDARGITATFDPLGVFIRQWRFADLHVQSGEVEIQVYKANPEAVAPSPGSQFFCQTGCIWRGLKRRRPT